MALFRLREVFTVPVERVAGDEAGEKIVGTDGTACANNEESKSGGEEEVRLAVNPLSAYVVSILPVD